MNDTCTIFSCHIVTWDNTESLGRSIYDILALLLHRLHPWEQLRVVHTYKVATLVLGNHLVWNNLVTGLIILERHLGTCRIEVCRQQWLGKNQSHRLAIVAVVCLHCNVVNLWTNTKRSV